MEREPFPNFRANRYVLDIDTVDASEADRLVFGWDHSSGETLLVWYVELRSGVRVAYEERWLEWN